MKTFYMIEKCRDTGGLDYFAISDSRNKNWIVEYRSTFKEVIHYIIGRIEGLQSVGLDVDRTVYIHENCRDFLSVATYFGECRVITEFTFQNMLKENK